MPRCYSAADLARALGSGREPTAEQAAVIEAPRGPLLVVAGAGSGKTETMASRVVWLVCNGHVEPDEVLGLTFTRKAASELSDRVSARLRRLQAAGLWTSAVPDAAAEPLGGIPTISTYHSYAGRLVGEHALRLGYEPDARLLSEAAAWQYAAEAVYQYDGDMSEVDKAESTVITAVVDLAGEMAEHLLTVADLRAELDRVVDAIDATPLSGRSRKLAADLRDLRACMRARRAVLPIVEAFTRLKRERSALDFGDQVALAAQLARAFPDIGRSERSRYKAVLLDEVQDTSEAQLALLQSLFVTPGEPVTVTAVGDPHQSIYGWRGASATTLSRFPEHFRDGDQPARTLPLSTSWRNDSRILQVANGAAEPLRRRSRIPVPPLRTRPGAGSGDVAVARLRTHREEASHIAQWLRAARSRAGVTAAVLCRKRSQFQPIVDALEEADVPYEVLGLGGLLLTPEVQDVVAALRVVSDPSRGDALLRLLTGAMCRLGAADLDGLYAWAAHRQRVLRRDDRGDARRPERDGDDGRGARADLDPDTVEEPSLVEAVASPPDPEWRGPLGQHVSLAALERVRWLGGALESLRALTGLALADLAGHTERALGLDIEVLARPQYSPDAARAHLDAFADVAAGFSASADRPTLESFLAWLDAALEEERGLDRGSLEPSPDAVQVLTVHAAKGLEWDCVAVPGLAFGTFPARDHAVTPRHDGSRWLVSEPKEAGWAGGLSGVPYALRGDRDGLPVLRYAGAADTKELSGRLREFFEAGGRHFLAEERRLFYVAVTRARRRLLLTTAVWSAPKAVRVTADFLEEVHAAADAFGVRVERWEDLPDAQHGEDNPVAEQDRVVAWPQEPAPGRRAAAARAAAAVRLAQRELDASGENPPGEGTGHHSSRRTARQELDVGSLPRSGDSTEHPDAVDVALLLAERGGAAARAETTVEVPRHLSASALVALADDPKAFALQLRRPMPSAPALAARRGTAFHAWVEQHYASAALVDVFDLPGSADTDGVADDEGLAAMKERFLASEWAFRVPEAIELPIETVLDGIAVRGRIDAVFRRSDGGYTVVDWKTGPQPSAQQARTRAVQLGTYALAYARLRGLASTAVDAAFYYAQTGRTVRPAVPAEEELLELLRTVPE